LKAVTEWRNSPLKKRIVSGDCSTEQASQPQSHAHSKSGQGSRCRPLELLLLLLLLEDWLLKELLELLLLLLNPTEESEDCEDCELCELRDESLDDDGMVKSPEAGSAQTLSADLRTGEEELPRGGAPAGRRPNRLAGQRPPPLPVKRPQLRRVCRE
jgi:hypothetical protein